MNSFLKKFFSLALLSVATSMYGDCNTDSGCSTDSGHSSGGSITSFFLPRSAGSNTAMRLVGWQDYIHRYDMDCFYGVLTGRFEYTRSFKPERIARQLFGSDVLRFQGSSVANRAPGALIADYFGLARDFDGSVRFRPRIENFIFDFNLFLGLDQWLCGLYFEMHLPIVHTRWGLFSDCDNGRGRNCPPTGTATGTGTGTGAGLGGNVACGTTVTTRGSETFPACYMSNDTAPTAPNLETALSGTFTFGDMKTPWVAGRFSKCRETRTRVADIDFILGWDFWKTECSHIGAYLQAVAPTGGRPCNTHIFEPVVGNGRHAGLGGGLTAHTVLWEGCDDQNLSIWLDGHALHLFKARNTRTFDLNNGPLSRYVLLKELDANNTYTGNLINAVNFTTREVETSIRVLGDASVKLAYRNCGFMVDVGYNIYGHSRERLHGDCARICANNLSNRRFGIKGCQGVCGNVFTTATQDGVTTVVGSAVGVNPVMLNTTASTATAFSCGTPDTPTAATTSVADQAVLAFNSPTAAGTVVPAGAPTAGQAIVAQVSTTPVVLSDANLNPRSGLAHSQLTHKIFGQIGWSWDDSCFCPFVSLVGEVEFDGRSDRRDKCTTDGVAVTTTTTTNLNNCDDNRHRAGLNQWGIGLKGGISF